MAAAQHKTQLRDYLKSHKNPSSNAQKTESPVRSSSHQPAKSAKSDVPKASTSATAKAAPSSHAKATGSPVRLNSRTEKRDSAKPSAVTAPDKNRTVKGNTRRSLSKTAVISKPSYQRSGKKDIDWLPNELMIKIFEGLKPQDLLNCARVCKRWHGLASDNLLWQSIYKQYAAQAAQAAAKSQKKPGRQTPQKTKPETIPQNPPSSFWKSYCIKKGSEFRNNRAVRLLEDRKQPISPFTGLPKGTNDALQKSGVRWVLCFIDDDRKEHSVFHKDVFYFEMSVCVRWYDFSLPSLNRIRKLKVYAGNPIFFDEKGNPLPNSPLQRSLLIEKDFDLRRIVSSGSPLATDEVVDIFKLQDGITIATWKDGSDIAFIAMTFHGDCLVKRCLFGTGDRPWPIPRHRPFKDDIDPKCGLHSYACILELRNMRTSFWSQKFRNVDCLPEFKDRCAVIQLIDPDRPFERSWIEKKLYLPWKTEALKGIVKEVSFLDVTVLDDQEKPMWCTSGLVKIQGATEVNAVTYDYEGDYSVIGFSHPLGQVQMVLIWEESSKKFFITSLQLHLSLEFVNRWFDRRY